MDLVAEFCIYSSAFFTGDRYVAEHHMARCGERGPAAGAAAVESINCSSEAILKYANLEAQAALDASRRALEIAESVGNPTAVAWALAELASSMAARRDASAVAVAERSLAIARPAGAAMPMFWSLDLLASLYTSDGRRPEAAAVALEALRSMRRKAAWMYTQQTLMSAVRILRSEGAADVAAQLLGAVAGSSGAGVHWPPVRGVSCATSRRGARRGTPC